MFCLPPKLKIDTILLFKKFEKLRFVQRKIRSNMKPGKFLLVQS